MYLTPNVRARLSGLLSNPGTYMTALENLRDRYGNPILIAQASTARISRLPNIKIDDSKTLDQYIGGMSEIITTLILSKQVGEINSPTVVKMALSKLPTPWRNMWGEEVTAGWQDMSLTSLREWLDLKLTGQEIGQTARLTYREEGSHVDTRGREIRSRETVRKIHNAAVRYTAICRGDHGVQECPTFQNRNITKRKELVRECKLCFGCLKQGHGFKFCRAKRVCGVRGCTRSHHRNLHEDSRLKINYLSETQEEMATAESENRITINNWNQGNSGVGVIAVQVQDIRGRTITARALIDEGSDASIASLAFIRKLGFTGKPKEMWIATIDGERREKIEQHQLNITTKMNKIHSPSREMIKDEHLHLKDRENTCHEQISNIAYYLPFTD